MSRYLVLYRANASVQVDPNQRLAVLEAALAGGDELLRIRRGQSNRPVHSPRRLRDL